MSTESVNKAVILQEIAEVVKAKLNEVIPQIIRTVTEILEEKMRPILEKMQETESKMFSIRDDVHRLLENEEMRKNKGVYSDVVVYGEPEGKLSDREIAVKLVHKLEVELKISEELKDHGADGAVVLARRMKMDPKPGEPRPLVITLAMDELRDVVIRRGNKKKDLGLKFKDNVVRETRLKRRVLGEIAGKLRGESKVAIVPFDLRAKLLVGERQQEERRGKLKKFTYAEAVREYGDLVGKQTIAQIRLSVRGNIDLEQILLL